MNSLSIRDIHRDDAPWIFQACQDPQIRYWTTIPRPYLLEDAQAFTRGEFPEYKLWVIEDESGAPVGVISIHSVDEDGVADIGYWIAPWGRGRGAATQAVALVERYARTDQSIKTLSACISDENLISQRVARAAGFTDTSPSPTTCRAGECQTSATLYRKRISRS